MDKNLNDQPIDSDIKRSEEIRNLTKDKVKVTLLDVY